MRRARSTRRRATCRSSARTGTSIRRSWPTIRRSRSPRAPDRPGSLHLPHAVLARRSDGVARHSDARRNAGRERPASHLAALRRQYASLSRHANRRVARPRAARTLRRARAARRRFRAAHLRPDRRASGVAGVPAAARCSSDSTSRCSRRRTRRAIRSSTIARFATRGGAAASFRRSVPTRSFASPRRSGRPSSSASPRWAAKRSRDYPVVHRRARRAPGGSSSRSAERRPTTASSSRSRRGWREQDASAIFVRALRGEATAADQRRFEAHMLIEMARMSVEDGLVMQLHPGALRDHNRAVFDRFGPDKGADIPVATEYTRNLCRLLNAYGNDPRFSLVLFTLDESDVRARARAARRALSGAATRAAVVVPRFDRGHDAVPAAGHGDGGHLQHRRLQRRHARLLLDSGAPRSLAAGGRELSRRSRRAAHRSSWRTRV